MCFGAGHIIEIVLVVWILIAWREVCDRIDGIGVVELERKLIEFLVFCHLIFGKEENFGETSQVISLISVPFSSLLIHMHFPFLIGIFLSFSSHHPFLYLLIPLGLHLLLPLISDVEKVKSVLDQIFLYMFI